ncbi:MAG: nuclear transport factor 2 family protein [Chloroflexi bacterium]|nr:nuclear transport factor 2 family protein [Chloroflexota bacterium]
MVDPVEEQLQAYNARDLERFLACYTDDVRFEDGDSGLLYQGIEKMRENYGASFARFPQVDCRIETRIRIGNYVIDEERITGMGPTERHAVVIYRVVGEKIDRVRILN